MGPIEIPCMSGFNLIVDRKGSREKANNRGDKGHPCLVPFVIGKGLDKTPFAFTCAVGVEYILAIRLSITPPQAYMSKYRNHKWPADSVERLFGVRIEENKRNFPRSSKL